MILVSPMYAAPPENEGNHYDQLYEDKGCEYSPSCLNCHLPECVHDGETPRGTTKSKKHAKDDKLMAAFEEVLATMNDADATRFVADKYGVTVRTIQRSLRRTRDR